ncbi:helix-turn-helix transcriptional regulator [Flavonifractor sp. An100]|uniref:helix-turn-helix domain-containing protein n=1 Tax=Flavonifractor sp. An100 TaxID=1965538 RepID=UPI000B39831C|nr:helix-turn-helix transcriptional regulator [Flavonifractor sp. An100]OUQ81103.1 hypothetical protein B5E43_02970 [Flavonifractor sp. An100]
MDNFSEYLESSFSKRLKLLRQKTGMTQRQAAEKIGVTAASLSAYENEIQKPSIEVVINTALAFNVSFGWLCGFYDDDDSNIPILRMRTALNIFLSMVSVGAISISSCNEDTTTLTVTGKAKEYCDAVKRISEWDTKNPYWNPILGTITDDYAKKLVAEYISQAK